MSGIFKSIGRALKKVWKSPIFKAIIIAAAIYFTAGVGLAAMGSTFAASLPGITAVGQAVGLAGVGAIAAEAAVIAPVVAGTAAIAGDIGGAEFAASVAGSAAAPTITTGASAASTAATTASTAWGGVKDVVMKGVVDLGKDLLKSTLTDDEKKKPKDVLPFDASPPAGSAIKMPKLEPIAGSKPAPGSAPESGIVSDYLKPTAPVVAPTAQDSAGLASGDVTGRSTLSGNSATRATPTLNKSKFTTTPGA